MPGETIPLGARIIAVADTFDAITSARPYRAASPHKKAIDILRAEAGTKLDPDVVRAFCSFYGGRRPIALWAVLAGLPQRVLSWLGGGVSGVASVAKMVAVAALVGGTAATTSVLAVPVTQHKPADRRSNATNLSYAQGVPATRSKDVALARTRSMPPAAGRRGVRVHSSHKPLSAAIPLAAAPTAAEQTTPSSSPAHAPTDGAPPARTVATGGKGETSVAATGKEAHGTKGSLGAGRGEAAPAKSEEAHGKSEEAHGKSEEAHGKSEEAHGKSEEAHGKSEEAHGKSEEPHGKSEEAAGKSEEPHGKSEEAHGKSEG
jgi:hypothetical protein